MSRDDFHAALEFYAAIALMFALALLIWSCSATGVI
jgi:hypothetical protein